MEEIKVEKGIPLPQEKQCGRWMRTFRGMAIGDSFYIEPANGQELGSLRTSINSAAKRSPQPFKITARRESGGLRVWRVE